MRTIGNYFNKHTSSFNRYTLLLLCLLQTIGCTTSQNRMDNNESINYSIAIVSPQKPNLNSLYSSIEIDTLEFSDLSIIGRPFNQKYYIHVPEKFHIVTDHRYVVNVFDTQGKFISSSLECIGDGPQQYSIAQDINYNSHSNTIEVLDVYDNIYIYDINFKFVSKHKIQIESDEKFRYFYSLSDDMYALINNAEASTFYLYSPSNNKAKKITYEGTIASISANSSPFREHDGKVLFFPQEVNNNVFTLDPVSESLLDAYNIEYTNSISNKDIERLKDNEIDVSSFISSESNKYTPLNKFMSDKYIYTQLIKQNKIFINIYNIETKDSFTFFKDPSYEKNIPNCHYIKGDTFYAIIQPFDIYDFIDAELLVKKEILSSIKEDGNPLIVKYKLKI